MKILAVIVALTIGIAVICFTIKLYALIFKKLKSATSRKRQHKEEKVKKSGITSTSKHISGLPIAENIVCIITSYSDKITITSNGATFNLEKKKITDVSIKTETEIQEQYVSSAGGAVGGAMLFGALGAVVGGRAKKKKTKTVNKYLIISYMSDEELKFIVFDVSVNIWSAMKIADDFRKNNYGSSANIDL